MVRYLLLALLLVGFADTGFAALIEGRVVLGDKPLAKMSVQAFTSLNPGGERLSEAVFTDAEGLFRLDLPAGFAALYAYSVDGRYFAFCGRNPLRLIDGQAAWAGLQAVETSPTVLSAYDDEYTAALEGVVSFEGKPVANAYVSLYLDTAEDLKGQGYRISAPTLNDGFFAFDGLPESDYFLVVRQRQNAARVGPLAEGDLLGVFAGNPLSLKSGKLTTVDLPMVVRKPSENKAVLPGRPGSIRLMGRIVDEDGQPVAGLHFFAYTDPVIGHQRPLVLSSETLADGRFKVSFSSPGVYYVGARQAYGDSPAPDELFGLYEGRADHGLKINPGKNVPIEIRVAPINLD